MAEISATMVRDLREKTGAGMMDCKKALSESGGDFTKAEEWLRKKGISRAASKGARIAAEGLVGSHFAADGKLGVLVDLNCETDFVARNPDFVSLAADIAAHVAKNNPGDVAALLEQTWIKDGAKKVKDVLTEAVAKIGENITVRRFARFAVEGTGAIGTYIHSNGRVGVLVELAGPAHAEVANTAKELAMQVAAVRPMCVSREQVPADVLEKEKEIFKEELRQAKKPEAIWDKILTGKLEKFYEGVCLVDQLWVKDDKKKIKQLLADTAKAGGADVKVLRFARIEVGEGIEKKKDDLAAEVAKTLGQ